MIEPKNVDYPYSDDVYTRGDDIPDNKVAYNLATMFNKYKSKVGNSISLVKGASNSLSLTEAIEVTDSVTISDTHTSTIKLTGGEHIPGEVSYGYSHGASYTHGTVKKFSTSNTVTITPKVDHLTATAYYYHIQMSGDRYMKVDGELVRVNKQPESFSAEITYAEGWFITRSDGTKAKAGEDY